VVIRVVIRVVTIRVVIRVVIIRVVIRVVSIRVVIRVVRVVIRVVEWLLEVGCKHPTINIGPRVLTTYPHYLYSTYMHNTTSSTQHTHYLTR
jgi:hypothetical protein